MPFGTVEGEYRSLGPAVVDVCTVLAVIQNVVAGLLKVVFCLVWNIDDVVAVFLWLHAVAGKHERLDGFARGLHAANELVVPLNAKRELRLHYLPAANSLSCCEYEMKASYAMNAPGRLAKPFRGQRVSKQVVDNLLLLSVGRLHIPPNIPVARMPGEFLGVLDAMLASHFSKKCMSKHVG